MNGSPPGQRQHDVTCTMKNSALVFRRRRRWLNQVNTVRCHAQRNTGEAKSTVRKSSAEASPKSMRALYVIHRALCRFHCTHVSLEAEEANGDAP